MNKGWIIYPQNRCAMNEQSYNWIVQQALLEGVALEVKFVEELVVGVLDGRSVIYCNGQLITKLPDFAIVRSYDFNIISILENIGVKLFNSSVAMRSSLDKFETHQILTKNSIPTPKTLFNCRNFDMCQEVLGEEFIVKFTKGSRGAEVFKVDNVDDFNSVVGKFDEVICQESIKSSYGRDIRVWVAGDKVLAAVLRYNENSFKSNFSLGGSVKSIELNPQICDIALSATHAVGLDFAGVDLLVTDSGYSVCEVNGNAAFRSIYSIDKETNIARMIFRELLKTEL